MMLIGTVCSQIEKPPTILFQKVTNSVLEKPAGSSHTESASLPKAECALEEEAEQQALGSGCRPRLRSQYRRFIFLNFS